MLLWKTQCLLNLIFHTGFQQKCFPEIPIISYEERIAFGLAGEMF